MSHAGHGLSFGQAQTDTDPRLRRLARDGVRVGRQVQSRGRFWLSAGASEAIH